MKTTTTLVIAARLILALDLGKYKSVACVYERGGWHAFAASRGRVAAAGAGAAKAWHTQACTAGVSQSVPVGTVEGREKSSTEAVYLLTFEAMEWFGLKS